MLDILYKLWFKTIKELVYQKDRQVQLDIEGRCGYSKLNLWSQHQDKSVRQQLLSELGISQHKINQRRNG